MAWPFQFASFDHRHGVTKGAWNPNRDRSEFSLTTATSIAIETATSVTNNAIATIRSEMFPIQLASITPCQLLVIALLQRWQDYLIISLEAC